VILRAKIKRGEYFPVLSFSCLYLLIQLGYGTNCLLAILFRVTVSLGNQTYMSSIFVYLLIRVQHLKKNNISNGEVRNWLNVIIV
jgi:hypothetical protein